MYLNIKQIIVLILGLIVLLIAKLIIYRKEMYIYPIDTDAEYETFFKKYNVSEFEIEDTKAWYIPGMLTDKIIIFCHGNALNITWETKSLDKLASVINYPIICVDYLRTNKPSIERMVEINCVLVDKLLKQGYKTEQIILVGESIGSAITLQIANKYKISNIINYIGINKISDIVKERLPVVGGFVSLFISEMDNEKIVKKNNFNLTLLNSRDDQLVNFEKINNLTKFDGTELIEITGTHTKPDINNDVLLKLKKKYLI